MRAPKGAVRTALGFIGCLGLIGYPSAKAPPKKYIPLVFEKQGPQGRAGKDIDETEKDINAGGEMAGNRIDDAITSAQRDVEDAFEKADRN